MTMTILFASSPSLPIEVTAEFAAFPIPSVPVFALYPFVASDKADFESKEERFDECGEYIHER